MDADIFSVEKMIYKVAWKYSRYEPLEDLIQEGWVGALIAQKKFDKSRNVKYSTFAFWWIRNTISEAVEKSRFISLPNRKYVKERMFLKRLETGDSTEDAAASAGLTLDDAMLILSSREVAELDAETDGRIVSEIVSDGTPSLDDVVDSKQLIESALSRLNQEERAVYVLYNAYGTKTSEIAEMLNMPKELVSKLLFYATKKVKRAANRLK